VAGVGPKIAVGILGALPSSELVMAVARGDVKRLQSVPGVGKKIAERLALELKDKLASGVLAQSPGSAVPFEGPVSTGPIRAPMRPLVDALLRLGFKPMEAERAAADLRGREAEPLDVLVREALRVLTS
jgi:Holliday junction DNA helicase RuvA